MDHLRAEKLKSYNQTFQSLDPENKGFLKPKMVRNALKHIGFNPTESELEERLVAIDQNENNRIEFEEFLELTNQLESKTKAKKEGYCLFCLLSTFILYTHPFFPIYRPYSKYSSFFSRLFWSHRSPTTFLFAQEAESTTRVVSSWVVKISGLSKYLVVLRV